MARLFARNYLITFAGSGASAAVDSVRVANLTQGTSLTVGYGNQLQLLGTLSVNGDMNEGAWSPLQIYTNPAREETVLTFEATANAHANCTGISFIDSTPFRVWHNRRILINKVFSGIAEQGHCSVGWFFGFKLNGVINEKQVKSLC